MNAMKLFQSRTLYSLFLVIVVMLLITTACGDDDEKDLHYYISLFGTWELEKSTVGSEDFDIEPDNAVITFDTLFFCKMESKAQENFDRYFLKSGGYFFGMTYDDSLHIAINSIWAHFAFQINGSTLLVRRDKKGMADADRRVYLFRRKQLP